MVELGNRAGATPEEMRAYVAALRDMVTDRDPLDAMTEFPEVLRGAVTSLPRDALVRPEAPGKWSVLQVVEHLADHEMIVGYRIRLILAHDEPAIQGFDQDRWAERLHWGERIATESLADFAAMRARNLRLLRALSPEERARAGVHAERGRETVEHFIRLTAGRDRVHLRQIERIFGGSEAGSG